MNPSPLSPSLPTIKIRHGKILPPPPPSFLPLRNLQQKNTQNSIIAYNPGGFVLVNTVYVLKNHDNVRSSSKYDAHKGDTDCWFHFSHLACIDRLFEFSLIVLNCGTHCYSLSLTSAIRYFNQMVDCCKLVGRKIWDKIGLNLLWANVLYSKGEFRTSELSWRRSILPLIYIHFRIGFRWKRDGMYKLVYFDLWLLSDWST